MYKASPSNLSELDALCNMALASLTAHERGFTEAIEKTVNIIMPAMSVMSAKGRGPTLSRLWLMETIGFLKAEIRALSPSHDTVRVPRELECVAWRTEIDAESHVWIASTVDHDIMAQGDTFEEARGRLEVAIKLDKDGIKTGPSPVCKTFRAMIAEVK